jgi:hypothetical protein
MESAKPNPVYIRTLTAPTLGFLCTLRDNIYDIKFGAFRIRDMNSGITLIDVREGDLDTEITDDMDPSTRLLKYHFGPDFLNLKTIGLQVEFKIGDKPVPNFQMIERHYFRDKCIKSFEFKFGFCMPNTTNTLEMIYDLPQLIAEEKQAMIEAPWETKSDTFFFVEDKLVIHNRAEYNYAPL